MPVTARPGAAATKAPTRTDVGVVQQLCSLVWALLFDPAWLPFVSICLLAGEFVLCGAIVMKVPCAYAQSTTSCTWTRGPRVCPPARPPARCGAHSTRPLARCACHRPSLQVRAAARGRAGEAGGGFAGSLPPCVP